MSKQFTITILVITIILFLFSFDEKNHPVHYRDNYTNRLSSLETAQKRLLALVQQADLEFAESKEKIQNEIANCRMQLKQADFWLRYLEPIAYRRINGPLPVEWETEVFEKFEAPYKREGTGLTQAALYLDQEKISRERLEYLISSGISALATYRADSVIQNLDKPDHFFLCNRLYLLNLASIYTTGFECPDTTQIIPELRLMMASVHHLYNTFNESFRNTPIPDYYTDLYKKAIDYVNTQPSTYSNFDHFTFIKDFVNPLFVINQRLLNQYKIYSKSMIDYTLNKKEISIFNKEIYTGQDTKGIFHRVEDKLVLDEIERVGKLLFYDPILSANNERSCASCHKPTEYFTDTTVVTAQKFNKKGRLSRNSPSLINAGYNHLLMMDGKHISLVNQAEDVMTNPEEMGATKKQILEKVLSCNEYRNTFRQLLRYTPTEKEITMEHIASAIVLYYSKFSTGNGAFDDAINHNRALNPEAIEGFNLFMSKSQCATCHFVPQFNGVKPPFVGSEFEVLGVPADTSFSTLSNDEGRYRVHKAEEMKNAFRTGSLRNIRHTAPYMHNGVFRTLEQVVNFYNAGGGGGRGLTVPNQTLATDSLGLSAAEKNKLVQFMVSLSEEVPFEGPPERIPISKNKILNTRKVGGTY